ncbi:MAG: phage virion morphogenesis protein [Sphingomonas sp.]
MAGADFRIDIEGGEAVERRLALLADRFGNLQPLMETIGQVLATDAEDNFEGEHSPDGAPWKKSQRVLEHGGKTLQLSRRLRMSITYRAGASSVEVGTNVVYARRHQEGFHGPERVASFKRTMREVFGVRLAEPIEVTVGAFTRQANTPARPFLGMSAGAQAEILHHAEAYIGGEA